MAHFSYPFTDCYMHRLTFPKSQAHMNLFSRIPLQIPPPLTSCSYKPQNLRIPKCSVASLPARDRVIDFGKYRGKMLGTLPSTYLRWVSKNLRARDFEEWAQLADQVLEDPVYKDRIEWEFAQNVLNGDVLRSSSSSSRSSNQEEESPVAELAEISVRFGWDYEDKLGWAKVDFELLGTSDGGRLPRLSASCPSHSPRPNDMGSGPNHQKPKAGNTGGLSPSRPRPIGEKRKERMQRMKLKRNSTSLEGSVNFSNPSELVLDIKGGGGNVKKEENTRTDITKISFPGRESLLKKLLTRKDM